MTGPLRSERGGCVTFEPISRALRGAMPLALAGVLALVSAAPARAAGDAWGAGATWLTVRAGYAKITGEGSGEGLPGGGLGFRHMFSDRWGLGVFAQVDGLAHRGASARVAVPFTVEITRHFRWTPTLVPYLGVGGGVWLNKVYRTGEDRTDALNGSYVVFGADTPIAPGSLLGTDWRVGTIEGASGVSNPVFGHISESRVVWSAKLDWIYHY